MAGPREPKWHQEQLAGLEDEVLWHDVALVVSSPVRIAVGVVDHLLVRWLEHDNFLAFDKRICTRDTTHALKVTTLPQSFDDLLRDYQEECYKHLRPFI